MSARRFAAALFLGAFAIAASAADGPLFKIYKQYQAAIEKDDLAAAKKLVSSGKREELEGMEESLAFAHSAGFEEIHRMRGMSLRAEDFSYEKWRGAGERLYAEGFTATTLRDEEAGARAPVDKLAELQRRASGATQGRSLRELAEALDALSVDEPVILVFDDLQWTDPSTAEFLAFMGSRREPARVLILGTYRPAEVTRGHPLSNQPAWRRLSSSSTRAGSRPRAASKT